VGIGELDNHDSLKRLGRFSLAIFPFARVLRLIRTHILTAAPLSGEGRKDIPVLLDTLKRGRAYVSLDHYRAATGFRMFLTEEGRAATMGDPFSLRRRAELTVSVPHRARIRIIRNGTLFAQARGTDLSTTINEPGVYRMEADLEMFGRCRPWIYSNPVYVNKP